METIEVREESPKGRAYITPRELAIVRLTTQGLISREIAKELGLSLKTVEVHRHNALKRNGCRNTPSLVGRLFKDKILIWNGDQLT